MKTIEEAVVSGKKVLVRVDANVPMDGARITDNYRLKIILPTINFLIEHGAKIILVSHLGRPGGKADPALSLQPIYTELAKLLNKSIIFAPDAFIPETAQAVNNLQDGQILGLENIRFYPGEEENSPELAEKLAAYGEIYVNDAFSVSHRDAASLVAITQLLPSYAGILLEQEYKTLSSLLVHPAKPFVVIIGGAKIADKLPVIKKLLDIADRILVGGGVANTFVAASGTDVKKSLIDQQYFAEAQELIKRSAGKLVLPTDFTFKDEAIIDIGPKSTAVFEKYLKTAKMVFWNGNLGMSEQVEGAEGSEEIARAMADCAATTVVAGGNTIELCNRLEVTKKMSFASSGGGATLEFLSGETLPGIAALEAVK